MKNDTITYLEKAIEEEKKEQWRAEGRHYLFDAKRVHYWKCFSIISAELVANKYYDLEQ